jgi:hypothetical protein
MMSKKEMGLLVLAGAGIVGIAAIGGIGGNGSGGGARAGQILGSPGALPSTGTSSAKLASAIGGMPMGAKTLVTPQIREEFSAAKVKQIPSKTSFGGKQVSPTYIPEAATQAYIANAGSTYVAPTFTTMPGTIVNGSAYIAPAGLYPKSGGLTAKGIATKKKVEARQASGFTSYSGGSKGTASAQKAAYKARSG